MCGKNYKEPHNFKVLLNKKREGNLNLLKDKTV